MLEWDPGPSAALAAVFNDAPLTEYVNGPNRFRVEWGPIYYRGRTDGSAKVVVIGQDPAADENVARRILVGDAGQRVQGLLRKLGLTRAYVMVNALLYSIRGQFNGPMETFMDRHAVKTWRNRLLDAVTTANIQAVIALGKAAHHAIDLWPGAAVLQQQGRVFKLTHPTARPAAVVLNDWNAKLAGIAAKVTADADGIIDATPYAGPTFKVADLARIPLRDFGFGVPVWMGTGDTATRLNPNQSLPATAQQRPTILWSAIGDQG